MPTKKHWWRPRWSRRKKAQVERDVEMPTKAHRHLVEFADKISEGQYETQRKFIRQALFGLHSKSDNKTTLAEWGRALQEETKIDYTTKRLSRNLSSKRLDDRALRDRARAVSGALIRKRCTAISVDATDATKRYAKKMAHLATVPDGSNDGELGNGWMILRADAVSPNGRHVPVDLHLYSRAAPEFRGDNVELRSFLAAIRKHVPPSLPFVFDRGLDGENYRKIFNDVGIRFTVRLAVGGSFGRRSVRTLEGSMRLAELRDAIVPVTKFRISRFLEPKKKDTWIANVGWCSGVRFVERVSGKVESQQYTVVVSHRRGKKPMVILSTDRVTTAAQARAVVDRYFDRWIVEEGHRVMKQRLHLEKFQVRLWPSIKRMAFLVHAAFLFLCWLVARPDGEAIAKNARAFGSLRRNVFYCLSKALDEIFVRHAL